VEGGEGIVSIPYVLYRVNIRRIGGTSFAFLMDSVCLFSQVLPSRVLVSWVVSFHPLQLVPIIVPSSELKNIIFTEINKNSYVFW
jgi:hypothetical protein